MGLESETRSGTYIKVVNGMFAVRCQEGDKDAKERTLENGPNAGDIIYEKLYGSYRGFIKKAWIKEDGKYGATFSLKMSDGNSNANITVPLSSRHAKKFFGVMNRIDLDKEVVLTPYKMDKKEDGKIIKDKFIHGWTVKQDDEKLESTYSREDVPEMEKIKVKGKEVWDDTAQLEFFKSKFEEWKEKNLDEEEEEEEKPKSDPKPKAKSSSPPKRDTTNDDIDDDDVPF